MADWPAIYEKYPSLNPTALVDRRIREYQTMLLYCTSIFRTPFCERGVFTAGDQQMGVNAARASGWSAVQTNDVVFAACPRCTALVRDTWP